MKKTIKIKSIICRATLYEKPFEIDTLTLTVSLKLFLSLFQVQICDLQLLV